MRRRSDLRLYQEWLAEEIQIRRTLFVAIDMGMGKTAIVLTAARDLFKQGKIRQVLIVAPLRVAEETWPDEIAQWAHTAHLTYAVATGMPGQRKRAINQRAQITIINRENLPWLWKMLRAKKSDWPYDMVVWDESSGLKEWRKRTAGTKLNPHQHNLTRFGAMAQARKFVRYMVLLTGTPAPRGVQDLGGQAYILDQGQRLGDTKEAFLSRWFDRNPYDRTCEPKKGAQQEIMSRLQDVMVSLQSEDYIDLPPVVFNDIHVTLDPKVLAEYRKFERDLVTEVYDVEAFSQGVLTNKLLQYANGALYRGSDDLEMRVPPTIVPVHTAKLDALDSVIQEAAGNPVMVSYGFKFDLERIKKRFPNAVVLNEEKDAVKRWNAGKVPILLAHPASAGHGLNLQFGGHIACWYGLNWSLELYQQFNKRLPRSGQTAKQVIIHRIIARNTVDETVLQVMDSRGAVQQSVNDAVRVRLEGML